LTACTTTTLTASTDAINKTYLWYKDNVVIALQTASTLVVTASGAYTVKIINTDTSCEATATAGVIINALPTASISGILTACTTTTLTASTDAETLVVTASGAYTVKISNTDTSCEATAAAATVTINALPTASIVGTTTVCKDASSPDVTFTGSGGTAPYTFTYKIGIGGASTTVTTTSGNSVTIGAPTATEGSFDYSLVSIQDASFTTCSQLQTGTATITVNPFTGSTSLTAGATVLCQDASNEAYTATAVNATSISYSVAPATAGSINATSGLMNWDPAFSGTATITATASGLCSSTTASRIVQINPLPSASISGSTSLCENAPTSELVFSAIGGTAPYTFVYTINGGSDLSVSTSSGSSLILKVSTATSGIFVYRLISVQDASTTSCAQAQTGTATIIVRALPTATISSESQSVCSGSQMKTILISDKVSDTVFSWTRDMITEVSGIPVSGNGGEISGILNNRTNEPIMLTFTIIPSSSTYGCIGLPIRATVVVNPSPNLVIGTMAISICSGTTFQVNPSDQLSNTVPQGTTYIWATPLLSPPGSILGAHEQTTGQTDINQLLTNPTGILATATYTVTPLLGLCLGVPFRVVVNVNPAIIVSSLVNPTCDDSNTGSIKIAPSGGKPPYTYEWSNGSKAKDLAEIPVGNYTVWITDAAGCKKQESYLVNKQPMIQIGVKTNSIADCKTKIVTKRFEAQISGGFPPYQLRWSGGLLNGTNYETDQDGTITLELTDALGCTAKYIDIVKLPVLGEADFSLDSQGLSYYATFYILDPIQFTNQATGDYTAVHWDFGDGTSSEEINPIHAYLKEGEYEVIQAVSYPLGCSATKQQTLKIERVLLMLPNAFTPNNNGKNDTFKPVYKEGLFSMLQLDVFDPWGGLLYTEKGATIIGWDGILNGSLMENGNYYYKITTTTFYGLEAIVYGPFMLIR
jgi:gliding motility-associated-like protein